MSDIFIQLALILGLSSILGFLANKLKLPIIPAYLLAGVLIGSIPFFGFMDSGILKFLPELGIALVLFLIGMELNLWEIKSLGVPIVVTSIAQTIISTIAGFSIAGAFGFGTAESFYLGVGIAFSSTIVAIKLLLEKKDLNSLYGKLAIGILIVEDLVAIGILMAISVGQSTFGFGLTSTFPVLALVLKAAGLFVLTFVLAKYALKSILSAVAGSVELLFLTALTWCFVFTSLAVLAGFSVVIGAFLAGIALASSPYQVQISGKIKPLRDFFLALFFVYLGSQVRLSDLSTSWFLILTLTTYVLTIKPLLTMVILGIFGFKKHTMFQAALNLSHISEFSLIILLLGVSTAGASPVALSVMSAAMVLSMVLSSISIGFSKRIYRLLAPFAGFFEHSTKSHAFEVKLKEELLDHIVIFGSHKISSPLIKFLKSSKIPFMVIGFNPKVIEDLRQEEILAIYGDMGDPDILEGLQLENAKLIICTAEDLADNELLLLECKRRKIKAPVVVTAEQTEDEDVLKKLGADYVIIPDKLSGEYLVEKLKTHWPDVRF